MLLLTLIVLLANMASYKCSECQDVVPPADLPYAWTLVFRGTANINKSVFDAYISGAGIPENVEPGCQQVDSAVPCSNHYRNNEILEKWTTITKVALVLYERNVLVGYMIFNGQESDYMNWFSPINLIESSWTDLKTSGTNYFSIEGDYRFIRRYFVNRNYGGCPNDWGWFVAIDTNNNSVPFCPWDGRGDFPTFLYAKGTRGNNWAIGSVGRADVMAIYVK